MRQCVTCDLPREDFNWRYKAHRIKKSKGKLQTDFQSLCACQQEGFDVEYLNLEPPST